MISKTVKSILFIILIVSVGILSFKVFVFSGSNEQKTTEEDYRDAFRKNYKMFSPKIPKKLDFAGEEVPLDVYHVRESLDRELLVNSYWHSNTMLMFKRAYRYFPVIEPILKENNIPDDFKYVVVIESGFMNVTSPAGAKGFWQFMSSTGKSYGLEINNEIDERYHLEKATVAACKYIQDAYNKFESWTMAAASYNMGMAGLNRDKSKQEQDNYYDILLNRETSRYVPRILALKCIMENPTEYGFYFREKDFYPPIPTKKLTVDSTNIDLIKFAKTQEITYKVLKDFNPWLLNSTLVNKYKKTYTIDIPEKKYLKYSNHFTKQKHNELIYKDTIRVEDLR